MTTIELLRQAILDQHGLDSEHVESVTLRAQNPTWQLTAVGIETLEGELREGTIHVFRVLGHPQAELAYAWSCKGDRDELRHIAVLGVPPIDSAQRAYEAAVLAELSGERPETETDPDLLAVLHEEYAAWAAKSYEDLREALAAKIYGEVCYRRGPDDLYKVEAQIMARGPDYLHVWVSVRAPHDAVFGGFVRHADGRLEICPDLAAVFSEEYAAWTAKSYDELREALADVTAGETCCRNYVRGPDDLYQVEVRPLEDQPDYLHVLVYVSAPYDAVNRSFIRYADGRLDA